MKTAFQVSVCPCAAQYVTAGANPISVKKGIDKTCDFLVEKLREKAQPVKGSSDIKVRCCSRVRPCASLKMYVLGTNPFGRAAACLKHAGEGRNLFVWLASQSNPNQVTDQGLARMRLHAGVQNRW